MKFLPIIRIPFLLTLIVGLGWLGMSNEPAPAPNARATWDEQTSLADVLMALGDSTPRHLLDRADTQQIRMGRELFLEGRTTRPGHGKSKKISIYFNCTQCHNIRIEDPDLRVSDPQARLEYVVKHDLPFLQATTVYGIVNRESWYNGDYYKKYGDLVYEANKSLAAAVQLCAKECAQGRYLEDWELKAILAYFWSIEFKLKDLDLSEADWQKLKAANANPAAHKDLVPWLKGFYLQASPATFGDAPFDRMAGFDFKGDPDNGALIYAYSCMTCHDPVDGVSYFPLDESPLTHRLLFNHIDKYSQWSMYQVIKYGTKPLPGSRPYMPHYTLERMNNQQVEDLRAYITKRAGKLEQ